MPRLLAAGSAAATLTIVLIIYKYFDCLVFQNPLKIGGQFYFAIIGQFYAAIDTCFRQLNFDPSI
jgi:hypothetical protein